MTKSFLNFILRSRFVNQKLILGADVLLSGVVTWLTYLLSNNLFSYHLAFGSFWIFLVLSMVCSLVFFLLFRTYKGIIRHSSLTESLRIMLACLLSALATAGLVRFVFVDELPTSLWVFNTLLDFLFTFVLLVLVRVLLLLLYQHSFQTQGVDTRHRLLIYIDPEKDPVTPSSFSSLVGDNLLLGYVRFGSRDTQRIGGLKL